MIPCDQISLSALPHTMWGSVDGDVCIVKEIFSNKTNALFTRYGDGEQKILENNDELKIGILRALQDSDVVGLPDNYTGKPHSWRTQILNELKKSNVSCSAPVVSAVLPLFKPSILSNISLNKKVIWITNNSHIIIKKLQCSNFCNFYGFDCKRNDINLQIVPGRTKPYFTKDIHNFINNTFDQLTSLTFDIAIIGAGACGKIIAHKISSEMQKQAFDAGCILSALRGYGQDRLIFQKELKDLVWLI